MANWSAPAPTAPDRENWLHDQSQLPPAPSEGRAGYVRWLLPIALGLAFTAGMVALAFQARATWDSHRDWVVPTTVPLLALGGVAMAYLFARRAGLALLTPIVLILLLCGITVLNIWRGAETEGSDGLRDAMSIIQGVLIGLTVLSLVVAAIYVEATRPTRPPESPA
jgi:hypothetical protein